MNTRAIFLVHGVGTHSKGKFLESVIEPLIKFLRYRFPGDLHVNVDQRPADGPPSATIEFGDERWEIREAWWCESFYPQPAQRVLRWGFSALARNAESFVVGMFPFLDRIYFPLQARALPSEEGEDGFITKVRKSLLRMMVFFLLLVAGPFLLPIPVVYTCVVLLQKLPPLKDDRFLKSLRDFLEGKEPQKKEPQEKEELQDKDKMYRCSRITPSSYFYDMVVGVAALTVLLFLYFPILVIATAFYVLALLPSWLIFPQFLRKAVVGLVTVIIDGPGDQYALMFKETAAMAVRQQLIDVMRPFLDKNHPDQMSCANATVIAHSGGATVALGVLTDMAMWEKWAEESNPPVKMTLITVGSSLNFSWENVPSHPMWKPLPGRISWVDLWSRYDWVPHGLPWQAMVGKLKHNISDEEGWFHTQRVVNRDSIFSDHHEYWGNYEEVVSRLVYEIAGEPTLDKSIYTATQVSIREAINEALDAIENHRDRIGFLNGARLVVGGLILSILTLGSRLSWIGEKLFGLLPDPDSWASPFGLLVSWPGMSALHYITGFAVVLFGLFAFWQIIHLWLGWWMYKDPWQRQKKSKKPTPGVSPDHQIGETGDGITAVRETIAD